MAATASAPNGRADDAFRIVRTCQVPHAFHTMAVESVPSGLSVYCGCADGKVRLYWIGKVRFVPACARICGTGE
eukprot:4948042-Pyramimonas_sp.AAC.1